MVTVYDVAEASKLSIASVSRAINGQPGVSKATAERIRQIAKSLGYQPNDVARSLVAKSTQTIALLVPDITNPFFPELVKGVQTVADREGQVLLLSDRADLGTKLAKDMAVLRRKQVDGVIVVAGTLDVDTEGALFSGIPTVFLDRPVEAFRVPSVGVDHESGAYQATRHLIELGHRRIAHIAGPVDILVSRQRLAGWARACHEAGIDADPSMIVRGDFLEEGGHRAGAEMIDSGVEFTAVFVANDLSAIGFLALCAERGISVPEDVSVIGFDGIHLSRYTTPTLTTVAQPILELGVRACEMLLDLIHTRVTEATDVLLPTTLSVGRSTRKWKATQ